MAQYLSRLIWLFQRRPVEIVPFGFTDPRLRQLGVIPFGFAVMLNRTAVAVCAREDVRTYLSLPPMFADVVEGVPQAILGRREYGLSQTDSLTSLVQAALGGPSSLRIETVHSSASKMTASELVKVVIAQRLRIDERLQDAHCKLTLIESLPKEPSLFGESSSGSHPGWKEKVSAEYEKLALSEVLAGR